MLYSSFFLPAPSTPTLHCLCCISCNYHTCFKIINILNLSDFKRLSNPKILQSALFCFWESSPPGRVPTKQFQKADSLFKGWALSASSSCIVCLLLDLRLLLLLLFLGSMQQMKWCLFIYWFLFFLVPELEHKITRRETPSVTHPRNILHSSQHKYD